ncbi:hypothetical protein EDD22DRAFT_428407 [Suillus occidentalis]|nr:hypothetical protein EDD22DRAFT_428407 [Suillus occidentalis]
MNFIAEFYICLMSLPSCLQGNNPQRPSPSRPSPEVDTSRIIRFVWTLYSDNAIDSGHVGSSCFINAIRVTSNSRMGYLHIRWHLYCPQHFALWVS